MAALTPAETELEADGPIEDAACELETLADRLADPGRGRSVFGVEPQVVRVERDTGAVAASGGIVLVPCAFELRSDVEETVCVADGAVSGLLDLDLAARAPEEVLVALEGLVTEITEVFNTLLVAGSSTGEASSTAATVGIMGAATVGATDAAASVSAGTGDPFVVGPTCPAPAPTPLVAPAPTPAFAPTPAKSNCSEEKKAALFQMSVATTGSPMIRDQPELHDSGTPDFYPLSSLIPR